MQHMVGMSFRTHQLVEEVVGEVGEGGALRNTLR